MARVFDSILDSLLHNFRQAAAALPDARRGSNKRYAVADAASCALATFFSQAPSFLNFQRRMQKQSGRSNCHTLFGVQAIPCDNQVRALLDGLQIHCSDSIRCAQCSIRHVGKDKTAQYFHSMLSATVVADSHNRVIPLMPEFVQPQQDPAAQRPELTEDQRKQDGEHTYTNTFFTSLQVTADNVAEIARVGRARWKIENEGFNCLARHGYNLKRNFGHSSKGLVNLLATLNLFAFALHEIQDCACERWRRCRELAGPRREFFEQLRFFTQWFCFRCWTALFETLLEEDPPTANPRAAAPAPS